MLSTRQNRSDTHRRVARAQRPIAAKKAKIQLSTNDAVLSEPRSPKKAKRAKAYLIPRTLLPASPTSKKSGRKAAQSSSPNFVTPSAPVPKKARARLGRQVTHGGFVRPSPSPISAGRTNKVASPIKSLHDRQKPNTAKARHHSAGYLMRGARLPQSPIAATDQSSIISSSNILVPDLVAAIRELYRRRQDFLNEEGSLSRRIKKIVARCKGQITATDAEVKEHAEVYPPLIPFLDSLKLLRTARLQEERKLKQHAEQLPVWTAFGDPIHNFGVLSLGQIVGEAGDLAKYSNPAKLWKRMGLALVNGERQRKCLNKDAAVEHGYSPRRRSVMFVIGDNLVKGKSAYRAVYDERKVYERKTAEAAGLKVVPAAKVPKGKHTEYRTEGHIHLRAKRYMEKRLLRDLWRAWRGLTASDYQRVDAPTPAELDRQVEP